MIIPQEFCTSSKLRKHLQDLGFEYKDGIAYNYLLKCGEDDYRNLVIYNVNSRYDTVKGTASVPVKATQGKLFDNFLETATRLVNEQKKERTRASDWGVNISTILQNNGLPNYFRLEDACIAFYCGDVRVFIVNNVDGDFYLCLPDHTMTQLTRANSVMAIIRENIKDAGMNIYIDDHKERTAYTLDLFPAIFRLMRFGIQNLEIIKSTKYVTSKDWDLAQLLHDQNEEEEVHYYRIVTDRKYSLTKAGVLTASPAAKRNAPALADE